MTGSAQFAERGPSEAEKAEEEDLAPRPPIFPISAMLFTRLSWVAPQLFPYLLTRAMELGLAFSRK